MKNLFTFAVLAAGAHAAPFTFDTAYAVQHTIEKRYHANIPSAADALTMLNGLKVAAKGPRDGYKRTNFGNGWKRIDGSCNTRDEVLIRDGTNVQTGKECKIVSGAWVSPYDDAKYSDAHSLQIDHIVPLEEAWQSGAAAWTADQREAYANDLERPLLWAVTSSLNEQKGDDDPSKWKPPLQSFQCTYAKAYTAVKSNYKLTVTDAEKSTLEELIKGCDESSSS